MEIIEEKELTINLKKVLELLGTNSERTVQYHKEHFKVKDANKHYPISYFVEIVGFDFVTDSLISIKEASEMLGVTVNIVSRIGCEGLITIYTNRINRQRYIAIKDIVFVQNNMHLTDVNSFLIKIAQIVVGGIKNKSINFDWLGEKQSKILNMLLDGVSILDVGEDLGLTRERVRQIAYKSLRRFGGSIRNDINGDLERQINRLKSENLQLEIQVDALRGFAEAKKPNSIPIEMRNLMYTNISDLNFSVRCFNCLKSGGIQYVWQLVSEKPRQIMRFRNMGKKSLVEIENFLHKNALSFGMDISMFL